LLFIFLWFIANLWLRPGVLQILVWRFFLPWIPKNRASSWLFLFSRAFFMPFNDLLSHFVKTLRSLGSLKRIKGFLRICGRVLSAHFMHPNLRTSNVLCRAFLLFVLRHGRSRPAHLPFFGRAFLLARFWEICVGVAEFVVVLVV